MEIAEGTMEIAEGTVVVDRIWGGTHRGTVVRCEGRSVFVAWHRSFVEDELDLDDVEPVAVATLEEQQWRGGIGIFGSDGTRQIVPVTPR